MTTRCCASYRHRPCDIFLRAASSRRFQALSSSSRWRSSSFCFSRRALRFSRTVTSSCVLTRPPSGIGRRKTEMERPSARRTISETSSAKPATPVIDEFPRVDVVVDAVGRPRLEDLPQSRARRHLFRCQPIDFGIATVGKHNALLGIEQAQALRHVAHGRVEAGVLRFQLFFALLQQRRSAVRAER